MPNNTKRFIYVGNGNKALVEAIGLYRLYLEFCWYMKLDETYYVSPIGGNLISISCLDIVGSFYSFRNGKFNLFQYSDIVNTGSLINNLYKLNLHVLHMNETLHVSD